MPTESTKRAVDQLREGGYTKLALRLRDIILHVEEAGGTASLGFIEWRPELHTAQLHIRLAGLKPDTSMETHDASQT